MRLPEENLLTLETELPVSIRSISNDTDPDDTGDPADDESREGTGDGGGSSDLPDPVEPDDTPTGSRPWPDDPTAAARSSERQIYALLVGINDYPTAPLNGCLKDIEQIEGYLGNHYDASRLQVKKLLDSEATYDGIISGFRTHLSKAGKNDTVWFHFSGHGTEIFGADEFLSLEPNGKDQNLVCYSKDTDFSKLFLADKELAVLLNELQQNGPHIVVSLDCCHSGSGTREFNEPSGLKTRNLIFEPAESRRDARKTRKLETYLGGHYQRMLSNTGKLNVPLSRHVLLSACESVQKAGDMASGGVFTSGLIRALSESGGQLNYADLFTQTRASVQKIRKKQTPQFDTIASFNPYTQFLEGEPMGSPDLYPVLKYNGQWQVKAGAVHGLPVHPDEPLQLEIRKALPDGSHVGMAEIRNVGAQMSVFHLKEDISLSDDETYQAVLHYLPSAPILISLSGSNADLEKLKSLWPTTVNVVYTEEETDECSYEIAAVDGEYILRNLDNGRILYQNGPHDEKEDSLYAILDGLNKIAKWERTRDLDNPQSAIADLIEFEVGVQGKSPKIEVFTSPEVKIYVNEEDYKVTRSGAIGAFFHPKVRIKGANQDLYCYLLQLRTNYAIECVEGLRPYREAEHRGKQEVEIPMFTSNWGLAISKDESETEIYFKLIVTTEELAYQQLLQEKSRSFAMRPSVMRNLPYQMNGMPRPSRSISSARQISFKPIRLRLWQMAPSKSSRILPSSRR